jgi:GNAT superfamily N-acetyltransferase
MHLREATSEDAPTIASVAADAWWAGPASALTADAVRTALADLYDEAFLREVAAEAADESEFRFLVAVDEPDEDEPDEDEPEERVVGFASAALEWTDEVELFTLYVDPDRWGEGIGTELLETIAEWAAERGAERVVCSALAENPVAVSFFEERGFDRARTVLTEVGGESVEEYEFERPLDG